jgi:hypothetical protein
MRNCLHQNHWPVKFDSATLFSISAKHPISVDTDAFGGNEFRLWVVQSDHK